MKFFFLFFYKTLVAFTIFCFGFAIVYIISMNVPNPSKNTAAKDKQIINKTQPNIAAGFLRVFF
ncbi:hypothetical protein [Bacillus sp. FJAT-29814]|uniref:hypothetical protein n=1 Tax=Bacillus sp. FJAT-29814 TaxID=1729688 RepID=UPI00155FB639|nr:hypothetical protein [Bacillus sp. FJAT-29814]